jgi:hypothetical protein
VRSLDAAGSALTSPSANAQAAVKREATKYELNEDRVGKQYVEEFRRWLLAVQDVVSFALENTKTAFAAFQQVGAPPHPHTVILPVSGLQWDTSDREHVRAGVRGEAAAERGRARVPQEVRARNG